VRDSAYASEEEQQRRLGDSPFDLGSGDQQRQVIRLLEEPQQRLADASFGSETRFRQPAPSSSNTKEQQGQLIRSFQRRVGETACNASEENQRHLAPGQSTCGLEEEERQLIRLLQRKVADRDGIIARLHAEAIAREVSAAMGLYKDKQG
jgi:hypothetical protein